jgi:hypothetical protein
VTPATSERPPAKVIARRALEFVVLLTLWSLSLTVLKHFLKPTGDGSHQAATWYATVATVFHVVVSLPFLVIFPRLWRAEGAKLGCLVLLVPALVVILLATLFA